MAVNPRHLLTPSTLENFTMLTVTWITHTNRLFVVCTPSTPTAINLYHALRMSHDVLKVRVWQQGQLAM